MASHAKRSEKYYTAEQIARLRARDAEAWKLTIKAGVLGTRLNDHALGKIQMTSTQIRAAEILLRKLVPDLANVQVSGTINHTAIPHEDWLARLDAHDRGIAFDPSDIIDAPTNVIHNSAIAEIIKEGEQAEKQITDVEAKE